MNISILLFVWGLCFHFFWVYSFLCLFYWFLLLFPKSKWRSQGSDIRPLSFTPTFFRRPHVGFQLWIIEVLTSWPIFPLNSRFLYPSVTSSGRSLIGIGSFKYLKTKQDFSVSMCFVLPISGHGNSFFPIAEVKTQRVVLESFGFLMPHIQRINKHTYSDSDMFFCTSCSSPTQPSIFVTAIHLVSLLLPLSSVVYPQHCSQWCF